ncbi:phage tail protein [Sphingopyxis sp. MWB1]|uniref:phage tail protein n=1 Tax=Sphingopyxis sp. MWB1 TaxID=1537715 RepID=UPI00051A3803|nr:phage tail protein [Sphingopyxis sp. MWB1]
MATLVLGVAGGLIGGPLGAALGAAIGQQVDAVILRPGAREGPRLSDLKLQASTYGQQIPQLFGTMRVAGSVIWATDLIERRTKHGGGKGRPSVTEFSYSASLAIALSSRRIRGVRRIWADGNLLRGANGSFRERCSFRLYHGDEDQPVDPLIAGAVGLGSASGFRGIAYGVFEDLELGAFGNRIPSLTFEVEADPGLVDAGVVGNHLLGEAGRCIGHWPFAGYAASGARARDALAPLFEADGTRLISRADGWQLAPSDAAGAPLGLGDYRETGRGAAVEASDYIEQRRGAFAALPGTIRLRHYAPERDYQLGEQMSRVAGGGVREAQIDLPAVLPAASARALAERLARAAVDGRETLVWRADLAALALPVGAVVADGAGGGLEGGWRVAQREMRGAALSITLVRHQPLPGSESPATPGDAVTAPDWPDAAAILHLFDLPGSGAEAATAPRLWIAGAGSHGGWRGADCWFVAAPESEPVAIGSVRGTGALGQLAGPLTRGPTTVFDRRGAVEVVLVDPAMELESVDDARLLDGANRAMVGGEMIQFGAATLVAPGRWRLSNLLRGRAGSDVPTLHETGAPFLLLDGSGLMVPEALARWAEGGTARLQWMERNRWALEEETVPTAAAALRPLAPVHGRVRGTSSGGLEIGWVRRSRVDPGWRDHVEIPLGEAREAWRLTLSPPVEGLGPWTCEQASFTLSAADRALLPPGTFAEICQIGDLSLSFPLRLALN